MAGIAFRLQKLLAGESYSDLLRAYLYSAVISTGPFLVVIFTIAAIKSAVQMRLSIEEGNLLLSLIVYIFAFSMIGVSPFLYVVTRYLADRYYLKQIDTFTPSYLSALYTVFFLQSVIALPFIYFLQLELQSKWMLYCLYLFTSGIWIAMIYLSAARSYMWIVISFIVSGITSIVFSILIGEKNGFTGFLSGFTIGQGICFAVLTVRIFREFGYSTSSDFGFFGYFKKHPWLVVIGLFYYCGIWADKIIFWFSPVGETVIPGINIYANYDTPMFLSFVTVVPSMAFFLVQMETSFVKTYHGFYESIRKRASINEIRSKQKIMIENLSNQFQKYALFQGILSGAIIMGISQIADLFYLNPYQMGILRIGILGAYLQMGFLMILNIIFYFDFQKDAFYLVFLFALTNTAFTFITLHMGYQSFGFGYTAACLVSVWCGFMILNAKLKNLGYWTFMTQPIIVPKFKFEGEGK